MMGPLRGIAVTCTPWKALERQRLNLSPSWRPQPLNEVAALWGCEDGVLKSAVASALNLQRSHESEHRLQRLSTACTARCLDNS